MCKAWTIRYACSHNRSVRRSTCRGVFCGPSLRTGETKVRCSGARDPLTMVSSSICGSCRRAQVEVQLHADIEDLRRRFEVEGGSEIAAELDAAERELPDRIWNLTKELPPDGTLREIVRPARNRRPGPRSDAGESEFRSSLLSVEVKPEDVVEPYSWNDWESGWSTGWTTSTLESDGTGDDVAEGVGLFWPDDDVIISPWDTVTRETNPPGVEPDMTVQSANLKVQSPSEDHQKTASTMENLSTRYQVIPPHRRRRKVASILGVAQQAIEDLRSTHACGGYKLRVSVSN